MGRKRVVTESPEEQRARLVEELRLFNHDEAADLLEADGYVRQGMALMVEAMDESKEN